MGILDTKRNESRPNGLFEFTQGIDQDCRLATHEVRVQKAWAAALEQVGVLSGDEGRKIHSALDEALALILSDQFEWRIQDEDIHMNLERFVTEQCGALGKKMHIGRSRNDLIATTLRLFVRDALDQSRRRLAALAEALAGQAEKSLDVLIPGMTHLQHGQPIRLGHALAAHGWALVRDIERLEIAASRATSVLPLGSAALGGTTLELDLGKLARELGFGSAPLNSYDSVGDRDFILEGLDAMAGAAVHLSRLSEDLIIWSSSAMGLIRLSPRWSTGSSIMPNKRNPDVPELVRGKSAHLIAASANAHVLLKGVPTSYGSDLHEIKQVFLRSFDELMACLAVYPPFIDEMGFDREAAAHLLKKGHILATEIADELALGQDVPFREAYSQVAALTELAESRGVQVHELSAGDWSAVAPKISEKFMSSLCVESAVERRANRGGTALKSAQAGIAALRKRVREGRQS